MQDSLGGSDGASVEDVLAVPPFWSPVNQGEQRELYKEVRLQKGSQEWDKCVAYFTDSNPAIGKHAPKLNIVGVVRVENLTLWQSHAARWASMKARKDDKNDMHFHGKTAGDLEKQFV